MSIIFYYSKYAKKGWKNFYLLYKYYYYDIWKSNRRWHVMNEISIDPYLHVRTVKGFEYGSNGNNISFISDYTGVPQVWEVNPGEGWLFKSLLHKKNYVFQLCSRNIR